MGIFPRNDKYFDLFNDFVAHIYTGSELFVKLFEDYDNKGHYAERIKEVERECDHHSADILDRLNASFITPLDREDIYQLAIVLDDIMDMINGIARITVLYAVEQPTDAATQLARKLQEAVAELVRAFAVLKTRKDMREHIDRIRALEEDGDVISQNAIQQLFSSNGQDPVDVIKWLKIYEEMDNSLDQCRKVAKVLAGIIVKNA